MAFGKGVMSCGLWKNSYEKSRRPFGWAAVIFEKTVKGTHISSTTIPTRPSRGRGVAWEGCGASTMMRAVRRAHQSRAAQPLDKACGALAGWEVRGADEEAVARGGRERHKKNTN